VFVHVWVCRNGMMNVLQFARKGEKYPAFTQDSVQLPVSYGEGKVMLSFDNRYSVIKCKNIVYRIRCGIYAVCIESGAAFMQCVSNQVRHLCSVYRIRCGI
jgi:hypothetical protein